MFRQVRPFIVWLGKYFRAYGGWSAVFSSPLFLLALVASLLNYSQWYGKAEWIDLSQSLIPNMLGFSLGTYAILFSLISLRLKGALRVLKNNQGISRLEEVNASFFHFIFVQVIALMWSLLFAGSWAYDLAKLGSAHFAYSQTIYIVVRTAASFLGYLLLVYSLLLVIGASMVVYRLALIRDPADEPKSNGAAK